MCCVPHDQSLSVLFILQQRERVWLGELLLVGYPSGKNRLQIPRKTSNTYCLHLPVPNLSMTIDSSIFVCPLSMCNTNDKKYQLGLSLSNINNCLVICTHLFSLPLYAWLILKACSLSSPRAHLE